MVGSDGVIEWDPFFWGGMKQYKFMVIFRDLPYDNALFGLVYLMSPVGSEDSFPFQMVPFLGTNSFIFGE